MDSIYQNMEDEQIAVRAKEDASAMDYLLNKYNTVVKQETRTMYLLGGETEDLIQEGMIGLFQAVQRFDPARQVKFSTFARLCIDRKLYTAVTASNRKKNDALNYAMSIDDDKETDSGVSYTLGESLMSDQDTNPESYIIAEENRTDLERLLAGCLSKMEYQVISYYRNGISYTEIAQKMNRTPKAIDNAIQRARNKIHSQLVKTGWNR